MKPVLLIALNYVREQRWALLLLLAWVVFGALVVIFGQPDPDDALFFIKQQAIYGVAFTAFLSASAIHNDRRSRRILAVLSKGIERGQYLAGLLCGLMFVTVIYCGAMAAFGTLMFRSIGIHGAQLWSLLALLLISCALVATVALLFSTFSPPLVATAFTAAALGIGLGLAEVGVTRNMLPALPMMSEILQYEFNRNWQPQWQSVVWSIAEAFVLLLLASWIFGRKDIAVAVE
jgi:ABC-type transport system involved in multi-copper enzyme maturation permease subunit